MRVRSLWAAPSPPTGKPCSVFYAFAIFGIPTKQHLFEWVSDLKVSCPSDETSHPTANSCPSTAQILTRNSQNIFNCQLASCMTPPKLPTILGQPVGALRPALQARALGPGVLKPWSPRCGRKTSTSRIAAAGRRTVETVLHRKLRLHPAFDKPPLGP